jgi:hypothetical protein
MWPDRIARSFAKVAPNPANDSAYYGSYNKLLTHLFPLDGERDYTICPQFNLPLSRDSVETAINLEVTFDSKSVFILEIKLPAFLDRKSTRAWADEQVRSRLVDHHGPFLRFSLFFCVCKLIDFAEECPIPRLHAVSALGTRLCFYTFNCDTMTIHPLRNASDPDVITDVAPAAQWEFDLLDENGEQKLREIIADVDRQCAELELE